MSGFGGRDSASSWIGCKDREETKTRSGEGPKGNFLDMVG